ncbi:TadE/TadG family type IV pilus assembly protein [Rhodovulum euryhalinum]|uniref:Flp pilus assembly protein TadG n=1 Tax=Rhodovulum euryhalinum TaxID=35805 RepID=A0A4R2KPR7_9RHOB|nr:hypothetical protein [Rhodovulum euryhalinum]TCO72866.1 hypothetical protein EV655_10395 [Rhodovulum euryhalinum]
MLRALTSPFRRFARDTGGNMVIELLLVMPFFIWAILGIIVYFYGFQMKTLNLKGAYTISDLLSREMDDDTPVTPTYIAGLDDVFNLLTNTPDKMGRLRVTLVTYYDNSKSGGSSRDLAIDWSCGTDGIAPMTLGQLEAIYDENVPMMPPAERAIIVETQVLYRPPVWFGVFPSTMDSFVVTRLRFVPKLEFEDTAGVCSTGST